MNCHHSDGGEREEEMIDIPLSIAESWKTTSGVALTVGSSGGGCRKMVMKMSVEEALEKIICSPQRNSLTPR